MLSYIIFKYVWWKKVKSTFNGRIVQKCILSRETKEEWNGGTVDQVVHWNLFDMTPFNQYYLSWHLAVDDPPKIQTNNLVGPF